MTRFRKILTAGLAALTLGATVAATSTPADAFVRRGFGPRPGPVWHAGPGWRPGWGYGYGWRRGWGWGGPGPWVAGAVGGLALGALATGAYGYGYGCIANRPVYDSWGNFLGYRRVRVAC